MLRYSAGMVLLVALILPQTLHARDNWYRSMDEMSRSLKTINSVDARFTQEKHLRILAKPIVSQGRLLFQTPDKFRWEYIQPFRQVLILRGESGASYRWDNDHFVEEEGLGAEISGRIVRIMASWMKGDFSNSTGFRVEFKSGDVTYLRLVPEMEPLTSYIKEIRLYPGIEPGVLERIEWEALEGDITIWRFSDHRLNTPIAPELFRMP